MKNEQDVSVTPTSKFKNSQLKKRVITAVILIAIAINCLYSFGQLEFELVTGLVWLIASYEMARLCEFKARLSVGFYMAFFCLMLYAIRYSNNQFLQEVAIGAWGLLLVFMLLFPYFTSIWVRPSVRIPLSYALLIGGWLGLISLFKVSPHHVLYLFALVWASDITAYFTGIYYGKQKLTPLISPGKTWAGLVGGLAAALVVGIVAGVIAQITLPQWPLWLALALLVSLGTVVGDIGISLLKRIAGTKDSGWILPGHGGLLDRIDGLLLAAPLLSLGWHWL
jgi:phosphatidate cytidylyltransferase